MIVAETPSGPIELRLVDGETRIEFNCACDDALPYCRAQCCRLRQYYNVALDPDELTQYRTHPELPILAEQNGSCTYLTNDRCAVHEAKPRGCQRWHCSPGGVGAGVTERGRGWVLYPAK